jgi:hypothetical protein
MGHKQHNVLLTHCTIAMVARISCCDRVVTNGRKFLRLLCLRCVSGRRPMETIGIILPMDQVAGNKVPRSTVEAHPLGLLATAIQNKSPIIQR